MGQQTPRDEIKPQLGIQLRHREFSHFTRHSSGVFYGTNFGLIFATTDLQYCLLHNLLIGGMNFRRILLVYIITNDRVQCHSKGQQKCNDRQDDCDTFLLRRFFSFQIFAIDVFVYGRKNVVLVNSIVLKND